MDNPTTLTNLQFERKKERIQTLKDVHALIDFHNNVDIVKDQVWSAIQDLQTEYQIINDRICKEMLEHKTT